MTQTLRYVINQRHAINRLLAGMLVFCFLLNGFVPRFSLNDDDYAVLEQIFASQSILLQFFSFSTVPVKIVNDLLTQKSAPRAAKQGAPRKQNSNAANTASDYSLITFEKKAGASRLSSVQRPGEGLTVAADSFYAPAHLLRKQSDTVPWEYSAFLIVLIFFFLLPRSSLSDGGILFALYPVTQRARSRWVFLLLTTTANRSVS